MKLIIKVRLKYDDNHSDQKFSESEVYPLIAWKHPLNASSLRGNAYDSQHTERVELTFREFLVRIRGVQIGIG